MPRIVPVSRPLFAFASEGHVSWLREAGARIVAVDSGTGETLREVRLDPAPFGIGWRVERQGAYFVVRDDREISAYDDTTGERLWKRTGDVVGAAFVGERDGRHVSVIPCADGEGIEIALADLTTGDFATRLRIEGTMRFIGAHGTLADDMLFVATDENDVVAIDTVAWRVVHRHHLTGQHALPPVATRGGVHVAAIERRDGSASTHVSSLDRCTGALVGTHTLAGAASLMTAGKNGLVLESRRGMHSPIERIAFRPETPSVRLAVAKHTDLHLVRGDVPQLSAAGTTVAHVHDAHDSSTREGGRRDEIVPLPRDGSEGARPTPREGLLGLLHLLDARSDVIRRLADAFEASFGALMRVRALGITLRDPRARWASGPGRDPSILELAVNRDGDSIGTYYYPPARMSRVPVVLVSKATGEARWLADDFDVWFAGVLFNAQAYSPQTVEELLDELSLPREFPQPLANATPPPWFFEAHATSWSIQSADRAMADGDLEGAERMLVSIARTNPDTAETRLIEIYTQLAWDHHRAAVVETW